MQPSKKLQLRHLERIVKKAKGILSAAETDIDQTSLKDSPNREDKEHQIIS